MLELVGNLFGLSALARYSMNINIAGVYHHRDLAILSYYHYHLKLLSKVLCSF